MKARGWLFPLGAGIFTQQRWWYVHVHCDWRARNATDAPSSRWQSRLGALGFRGVAR